MTDPLWAGVREGCGSCEFAGPRSAGDYGVQECRLHPPVLMVVSYGALESDQVEAHRPQMSDDGWCGQYIRRGMREQKA